MCNGYRADDAWRALRGVLKIGRGEVSGQVVRLRRDGCDLTRVEIEESDGSVGQDDEARRHGCYTENRVEGGFGESVAILKSFLATAS